MCIAGARIGVGAVTQARAPDVVSGLACEGAGWRVVDQR